MEPDNLAEVIDEISLRMFLLGARIGWEWHARGYTLDNTLTGAGELWQKSVGYRVPERLNP